MRLRGLGHALDDVLQRAGEDVAVRVGRQDRRRGGGQDQDRRPREVGRRVRGGPGGVFLGVGGGHVAGRRDERGRGLVLVFAFLGGLLVALEG